MSQIEIPSNIQIFTPNITTLQKKLHKMLQDNSSTIKIVSDFDSTLSRPHFSSWCAVERSEYLSQQYRDRTHELGKFYYPKEIDSSLTLDEKSHYMIRWAEEAQEALLEERITRATYNKILLEAQRRIILRTGCTKLFSLSNTLKIPLLVFSAGIADIVDSVLIHHFSQFYTPCNPYYPIEYLPQVLQQDEIKSLLPGCSNDNDNNNSNELLNVHKLSSPLEYGAVAGILSSIYVIANHLDFRRDETIQKDNNIIDINPSDPTTFELTDIISGFKNNKAIHVFNKQEQLIATAPYYHTHFTLRTNVLLLGDSLGDATMVHDKESDNIIRVGFLNTGSTKNVTTHLQSYLDVYDIVFIDSDFGIEWVNYILEFIQQTLYNETMVGNTLINAINNMVTQLTHTIQVGIPSNNQ